MNKFMHTQLQVIPIPSAIASETVISMISQEISKVNSSLVELVADEKLKDVHLSFIS
jgi:hypothetical protein